MILLLGVGGYIGSAFASELRKRGAPFSAPSRQEVDVESLSALLERLRRTRPELLINAAGFTGTPNVDACEIAREETLTGNLLLPLTVAHACSLEGIPWVHVSSGCIYSGAKIVGNGKSEVIRDLNREPCRSLVREHPEKILGFDEEDSPNFTFSRPPCSFYSGTKALVEKALGGFGNIYLCRLRIPFDEEDSAKNYLSKLLRYPRIYDAVNSISHRKEFVAACLDLWANRAPFGIYNLTNPGFVTTREVARRIQKVLHPGRTFDFWESDEAFYREGARAPRSNCVLDVGKALKAGVRLRPVGEALDESLCNWRKREE